MLEKMPERENHSHYRGELERSRQRLKDLEERGIEALSHYDINIAHGGDVEGALRMAKGLVSNHIAYYGEKLQALGPEVRQIDMFGTLLPAADIFVAPEPAEDDHLEDAYDLSQGEGFDWDDGAYDDDPSPYDGTYSEE